MNPVHLLNLATKLCQNAAWRLSCSGRMKLKYVNGSGSKGLNGIELRLICTMGQMPRVLRTRALRNVKDPHPLNVFSIEGCAPSSSVTVHVFVRYRQR